MEYPFKDDFEFIAAANGLTADQLCEHIGLARSYVLNVLNGLDKPSDTFLEKLYSFGYVAGLRINRGKEELFHERFGANVLYHGSSDGLTDIVPDGSRQNCDFGSGFYLGEGYSQAASFIADAESGSVYAFRFDASSLTGAVFHTDLDWMLLICYFRGKLKAYEGHPILQRILGRIRDVDYIRAPIADNKMFQVMRLFGDGEITTEEALHALSASNLGEQTVIKTQAGIKALSFLDRLYVSEPEKRYFRSLGQERAAEVETKLKLAKREYRAKGQYIDEVFS